MHERVSEKYYSKIMTALIFQTSCELENKYMFATIAILICVAARFVD